jgi:hypothetical protein
MNPTSPQKLGGIALIVGSLLMAGYSAMFSMLMPISVKSVDYVQVVINPNWRWLAIVVFIGILLMIAGFYAVYSQIRQKAGIVGAAGFLFIEAAYLLQACKVTWEIFLFPIIASHSESAFLLRDAVIKNDPAVGVLRTISTITIFLGILLFCHALYHSQKCPKAAPILIFAGALAYAMGPMIHAYVALSGIFTFAIGCFILGASLFKGQKGHLVDVPTRN